MGGALLTRLGGVSLARFAGREWVEKPARTPTSSCYDDSTRTNTDYRHEKN